MASDNNSGCGKIALLLGAIASLVAIIVFLTGKQSLPEFLGGPRSEQAQRTSIPTQQSYQTAKATLTPTVRATDTPLPRPSPTKTPIPSPTPLPDTSPGTVLEVGQSWRQEGIELRIKGPSVLPEGIQFFPEGILLCTQVKNNTASQIIFKLGSYSDHMNAVDNRGANLEVNTYNWRWGDQRTGWAFQEERTIILGPGETHPVLDDHNCWFVFADIGNPQVTEVVVTFRNISRISQAQWRIVIPH